ncbi:MAG: hypothetical protein KDA99_30450, partial [Planctomycetales bacterium]|nr:hypothetical protein [Planctomycetales bacterium]
RLADDPSAAVRQIAERPEWVEATLYVGVIGGAGYDYLAYTSFLRDKGWGMAGLCSGALPAEEGTLWHERYTILRQWMRAPLIDCTVSFLVVLLFSGVFVASGAIVLGPRHQLPSNEGFLEHQAQFVTQLHPWLYPLYVVGVLLTMLGTLYGTLEVAPTIMREFMIALSDKRHCTSGTSTHGTGAQRSAGDRYRKSAILWSGGGACLVLAISFWHQLRGADGRPPGLEQLLIPANLFTGVLLCGIVCLTNPWCDRKLPAALRLPIVMVLLNLAAGVAFVTLSVWSAWSSNGWFAVAILAGTVMVGYVIATLLALRLREPHPAPKREGNER